MPLGPLATYKAWQEKGRQVRKGEKALILCMPITGKRKGARPGALRGAYVTDQTAPGRRPGFSNRGTP